MKKLVNYDVQFWNDFSNPPNQVDSGYGPSGLDLWIYDPKSNYISTWVNWSGSSEDIKALKKDKALWCYQIKPLPPKKK